MSGMFAYFGDQATGSNIDISTFNTSSVTNMHEMFRDIALASKSLDLSHFNTTSVRDFGGMFYDAASYRITTSSTTYKPREFAIEELDISGFSTSEARYNNTSSGSGYIYGLNNMFGPHTDGINGGGTGTSGHHLKRVKLGTSFNFKGGSYLANYSNYWAKLQTPTGGATNGKWRMEENPEISATPEELQANYYDNRNDYAGWWIWDLGDNCEIVFNPNGGTTTAESIITDQADYPITMPDETTTTRPGYELIGWNTNPDGETRSPNYLPGETYTDVVRQGQQVILYAQWEYTGMYHYKIQYYQQSLYNEWNYSLVETKQYTGLVGTLIEPQIVEYPGFVYDRMSPAESKVITEDEKAQVAMYYIREYYTVHFDGNGAESGSIQDMKCMINRDYVIPENVFSYPGHLPVGWNTEPDGSGMFITNGAQFINLCENHLDEITLYAQWLDNENPEMTPTEGKIRVKIKAGQTIVFPDLPAGTTYEIEEIGMGPGWSFDYSDGAQGEIYSNDVSSSNFYNHYDAEGTVNFTIWKEIVGWQTGAQKPIEEGQFTFAMFANNGWNNWQVDTATNGAVDENEYIFDNEGNEIPNPHYGMAPVEFSYEFGTNDIGADYTFYIGELGEDPMYEADGQVIAHVHVEDGGQGALVFDVTYENTVEGKEDPQVITNTDLNGSDLYIYKNVTGTVPEGVDTEFSFKVELYDAEGRTLTDTVDAAVYDLESGDRVRAIELTAGDTVKMKPTEYISMTLPWGTQYKVTEADKDGWTLVQKSNTEGQIPSGEYTETQVAFTNAYDVDGTVEIPVTKTMIGRELTAGEFTFYILDEEGQTVASTVNDANGNATMAIAYSTEDVGQTYHYTVHEMKPDVMADASVIYDETVYNVDVEVVLNNGVLGGNITINGGEADSISFTNRYVAETSLTINGDKTLEGREFRESDAWTFTLTGDGPLPENSSVEIHPFTDATFSFTIPFSTLDLDGGTEKEFTYHVKESGFVPLISNDKTDWTFTVKVVDDSQGHLTATIVDGPETMTFTNRAMVTLPSTGSTTAIWVMLAGIAVITAGIWYSRKRKGELAE